MTKKLTFIYILKLVYSKSLARISQKAIVGEHFEHLKEAHGGKALSRRSMPKRRIRNRYLLCRL